MMGSAGSLGSLAFFAHSTGVDSDSGFGIADVGYAIADAAVAGDGDGGGSGGGFAGTGGRPLSPPDQRVCTLYTCRQSSAAAQWSRM
jgi:hypothetical protein